MSQTATAKSRFQSQPKSRQAKTTKRVLNVRLLVVSGLVVVVVGGLGFLWHRYEAGNLANAFLQRATSLADQEQWPDAAQYFERYLRLKPDDIDVRLQLIEAMEKSAVGRPGQLRLVSLLYQSLGVLPERDDLRLKLAEQLLALGEYQGVAVQAGKLIEKSDGQTRTDAMRLVALSLSAQAKPGGLVTIEEATKALEEALANNPGDVEIASITADFYRRYPDRIGPQATAANADAIMNRMVESDSQNPAAFIARYRYRSQYDRSRAAADLEEALQLEPDHAVALWLQGEAILASGDKSRFATAKQNATRIIELQPNSPEGYLLSARLNAADGNLPEAAAVLTGGRPKIRGNRLEIDYLSASLLLDLKKNDEARQITSAYSKEIVRWLPGLDTPQRLQLENRARLLKARLAVADGDAVAASRELTAIVASTDKAGSAPELLQAQAVLASLLAEQGRAELAADQWAELAARAPGLNQAAWRAAIALMEAGRPDEAVAQLKTYLRLPNADPKAWETLVKAELQAQGRRATSERDWTEFQAAVEKARQLLPRAWEWQFAEAAYLASQGATDGRTKALAQLRKIESQFPDQPDVRAQLVVSYQQLGDVESVERSLAVYDRVQPSVARRAALKAVVLASRNQIDEALASLTSAEAEASPAESRDLVLSRLKLLTAARRLDEAQELAAKLIDASPKDTKVVVAGLEIALVRKDVATAARWEELLKQADTFDQFEWRFYRARRLISEYNKLDGSSRTELDRLIESLRSERPTWIPVITLGAQYAAMQNNRPEAIEGFQAALQAGDRRPETLEQLVRLLYAEGRFDEAARYVSRAKVDESRKGHFESLAIAAAMERNRLDDARDLAKQAVDRKSNDPLHYIWLANLSQASGDRANAEQTYRTALQRFPQDVRVWNAVFAHFVQTGQADRARQTLKRWTEQVPMTEVQKLLVMGQGHERLGEASAAVDFYRQAVAKDAKDAAAHFLLGRSLVSSDVVAARAELLKVLEIDPTQGEARRLLSILLAASGNDSDWDKAVQYLEAGSSEASGGNLSDADDRLKAILLTRKGKNRQERKENFAAARKLFTNRQERSGADFSNLDRLLLAGIYEQEALLNDDVGALQAARDTLRPTVDRAGVTVNALIPYIEFLLRHVPAPSTGSDSDTKRELRAVFAEDARVRLDELDQLIAQQPTFERQFAALALRSKLLCAEGRPQDALKLVDEAAGAELARAETDADRAKVLLQAGNLSAQCNAPSAAESWYRRLMKIAPQTYVLVAQSLLQQGKFADAVELCLQQVNGTPSPDVAALVASVLATGKVDPALNRKAMQAIEAALDADRGNVELLMTVAVLRLQQEDDDDAIRMFRRVVELEPKNTLALNNLATLLAERPEQRDEALQLIESAISIAGRQPALLDTQGTILCHAGRHAEAIAALEESVAGPVNDPRCYFHLAMAYDGAGQQENAQRALETALQQGLDDAVLTKGDRELLSSLKRNLLTANVRE